MFKATINGMCRGQFATRKEAEQIVDDAVGTLKDALEDVCTINYYDGDEKMHICVWRFKDSKDLFITIVDEE